MASKIYKYRFLTENSSNYNTIWDETPPSTFNGVDVIDESVTVVDFISNEVQSVKVEKENIKTGERYQSRFIGLDCLANSTSFVDIIYPMPISIFTGQINFDNSHLDDEFSAVVSPNIAVGVISEETNTNSNVISVHPAYIINLYIGAEISITDGTNTSNVGRVVDMNLDLNTVTVETKPSNIYAPGSYILLNTYIVYPSTIKNAGRYVVGQAGIGGKYLPANTVLRIIYKNNGSENKKISVFLEYLF